MEKGRTDRQGRRIRRTNTPLIAESETTAGNSSLDAPSKARTVRINPRKLARTHPPRPPIKRIIPVPLVRKVVAYPVRSAHMTTMTAQVPD
jgi:hypothetical protein